MYEYKYKCRYIIYIYTRMYKICLPKINVPTQSITRQRLKQPLFRNRIHVNLNKK